MARAFPPRPSSSEAARPTASTRAPLSSVAINAGSFTTMPSPLTYTITVEVPRSMPIFLESTVTSIPNDPGEIWPDLGLAVDPRDMRAESLQLGHDVLVTAVQVIDVVEHRRPFGAQRRHDEGGARTN